MSWLSLAYAFANEDIPECAATADVGGTAFSIDTSNTRKVFGSVAGTYVQINTGADPEFDASGLTRLHFDACDQRGNASSAGQPCKLSALLGPSAAPGISGNAGRAASMGGSEGLYGGVSTGLVWAFASDPPGAPRRSLANETYKTITAAVTRVGPQSSPGFGVSFSVQYVLWADGLLLTEDYVLPPAGGSVNITSSLAFPGGAALFELMKEAASSVDGKFVFFSPPACHLLSAAVRAGDWASFLRSAPLQRASPPLLRSFGVSFPAMFFDGLTNYSVASPGAWQPDAVLVQLPTKPAAEEGGLAFRVAAPQGHALAWDFDRSVQLASRNGLLSPVYAELVPQSQAPVLSFSLEVVDWQQGI